MFSKKQQKNNITNMNAEIYAENLMFEAFDAEYAIQLKNIKDLVDKSGLTTSLFSCKKCKGNVEYIFIQTRSMDEGSTTKFSCTTCRTTWYA